MDSRRSILNPRPLAAALLVLAGLAFGACNGTIQSIGLPAASPWNDLQTFVASPYDDLTVVTVGSDISAGILGVDQGAVCTSDQGGFFAQCANPDCTPPGPAAECVADAPAGATNVGFQGQLPFLYGLEVVLDRPAFTAGGVQLQSVTAGTVGAIAITVDGGSTLNIGAGFSEGLIPGPAFDETFTAFDDFAVLGLFPAWPDFGDGFVCTDGTTTSCDPNVSPDGVAAVCGSTDFVALRGNAPPGPYSLVCGTVTVNVNVNPAFPTVGECISTLKAQWCSGLTGKARAACNHAQIGVCHASFNVPSAQN
jgi:hypothetical protein